MEYVQGIAEEIPGEDYDVIFSNYAMHYLIVDKDAVFKQFAAKLKKGGTLVYVVCVMDEVKKNNLPELYGKKFRDAYAGTFHYTSKEEFKRIMTAITLRLNTRRNLL